MPELPEVETIRRELERDVVGRRVKAASVHGTRTVRRQTKKQFISRVEGTKRRSPGSTARASIYCSSSTRATSSSSISE
jgi:formamidopyrimidine-DNA glycosylase